MTHRFLDAGKTDEKRNIAIIKKMENLMKEERKASVVCNLVYYDGVNTIKD